MKTFEVKGCTWLNIGTFFRSFSALLCQQHELNCANMGFTVPTCALLREPGLYCANMDFTVPTWAHKTWDSRCFTFLDASMLVRPSDFVTESVNLAIRSIGGLFAWVTMWCQFHAPSHSIPFSAFTMKHPLPPHIWSTVTMDPFNSFTCSVSVNLESHDHILCRHSSVQSLRVGKYNFFLL